MSKNTRSAAAAGLPSATRRGFGRSIVATAAAAALPPVVIAAIPANGGGAMVALHAAYAAAIDRVNSLPDGTAQATIDRLFADALTIEARAMVAPIVTAADCAAAVAVFQIVVKDCVPDDRALSFLARAADTLSRLAGAGTETA